MLTSEENEILTRVDRGTLMGEMMRQYWHPAVRSERLVADGAPVRVRLLGDNYVAFRATDGRVGFFDERCPHRCTSLALARNEENGLRCIFHGWKIDVSGTVVDVPTEPQERRAEFAAKIRVNHYPVREAGGIIWVYLNQQVQPPKFPDFEFTTLPASHISVRIAVIHCNWAQGMEAVLDSAHLGFLHRSSMAVRPMRPGGAQNIFKLFRYTPRFEYELTPYGFREASLRDLGNGTQLAMLRRFVAPYHSFLPGASNAPFRLLVSTVPIDNEWCAQWLINFSLGRPYSEEDIEQIWAGSYPDPDNFYTNRGSFADMWRQNRRAMKEGHWSGITDRHIFFEDFAMQESMGPIVDRSNEQHSQSDAIINFTRRQLIRSAREFREGQFPWGLNHNSEIAYDKIRSCAVIIPIDKDWREVDPFNPDSSIEVERVGEDADVSM